MEEIGELEKLQTKILPRLSLLDPTHFPSIAKNPNSPSAVTTADADVNAATAERLSAVLRSNDVVDFTFKVNMQAPSHIVDCSNLNNSKYYIVVVQYTARFNAEMVKNYLYSINDGKIPKKKFNLRLAPEEVSNNLTGFEHNAVTCIGMKTDIPVILDEAIVKL